MKDLIRLTGVFLLLLLITSCEKEDPDKIKLGYMDRMPAETCVGANSFGCYINGEIAAAQGVYQKKGTNDMIKLPYVNGFWDRYKSIYSIPGTLMYKDTIYTNMRLRFSSQYYNMQFTIENVPVKGINKCRFYLQCDTLKNQPGKSFESSVDITFFDKKNQIISGRFGDIEMNFKDFKDFKIHITKGQFDVKYGMNFELP